MMTAVGKWIWVAAFSLSMGLPAMANTAKENGMIQATGQFEVKLTPQAPPAAIESARLGRMSIDKQFQGDLIGHSLGEMLAVHTEVKGSAGYVALERVEGSLGGRKGSFVLQHSGTMNRGASTLTLTVVPDSGTGELAGLTGSMTIDIVDGQHKYAMDYQID